MLIRQNQPAATENLGYSIYIVGNLFIDGGKNTSKAVLLNGRQPVGFGVHYDVFVSPPGQSRWQCRWVDLDRGMGRVRSNKDGLRGNGGGTVATDGGRLGIPGKAGTRGIELVEVQGGR